MRLRARAVIEGEESSSERCSVEEEEEDKNEDEEEEEDKDEDEEEEANDDEDEGGMTLVGRLAASTASNCSANLSLIPLK
jgi:hypothetical protein